MTKRFCLLVLFLSSMSALGQAVRHDQISAVPVPSAVMVDGDLKEWDQGGALDSEIKLSPMRTK